MPKYRRGNCTVPDWEVPSGRRRRRQIVSNDRSARIPPTLGRLIHFPTSKISLKLGAGLGVYSRVPESSLESRTLMSRSALRREIRCEAPNPLLRWYQRSVRQHVLTKFSCSWSFPDGLPAPAGNECGITVCCRVESGVWWNLYPQSPSRG